MLTKLLIASVMLLCASAPAVAQHDCLRSLPAKSGKQTSLSWQAGADPSPRLDCVVAESYRKSLYVDNRDTIDKLGGMSAEAYASVVERQVADAERLITELESRVRANAALAGLRAAGEVALYAVAKAAFLTSCIAPEGVFTKFFCAGALLSLTKDTVAILDGSVGRNEYITVAEKARVQLQQVKSKLPTLKAKLTAQSLSQAQRRAADLFADMCQAIKRDCL